MIQEFIGIHPALQLKVIKLIHQTFVLLSAAVLSFLPFPAVFLHFSVVTINLRHDPLKYGSLPQKLDCSHFVTACVLRISFTASLVTFINTQGTNIQVADDQESRFFYLT